MTQLFQIFQKVAKIVREGSNRDIKLLEICHLIKDHVSNCDWIGFYLIDSVRKNELVLGPFVGEPTEHLRITVGKGVCGSAALRKETVVVSDVSKETNYLSCSVPVKSEIVVPIFKNGDVIAELDIDSHKLNAFDNAVKIQLEKIAEIISEIF